MDNFLRLTLSDVEYGTASLTVYAQANDFSGQSSAYFRLDEIARFASDLSAYPLPRENFPYLAGGYWKRQGEETKAAGAIVVHGMGLKDDSLMYEIEQQHVSLTVYPVGWLGSIGIQVKLSSPFDERSRLEDRFIVQLEVGATYQELREFSKDLMRLAGGNYRDTVLLGSGDD